MRQQFLSSLLLALLFTSVFADGEQSDLSKQEITEEAQEVQQDLSTTTSEVPSDIESVQTPGGEGIEQFSKVVSQSIEDIKSTVDSHKQEIAELKSKKENTTNPIKNAYLRGLIKAKKDVLKTALKQQKDYQSIANDISQYVKPVGNNQDPNTSSQKSNTFEKMKEIYRKKALTVQA